MSVKTQFILTAIHLLHNNLLVASPNLKRGVLSRFLESPNKLMTDDGNYNIDSEEKDSDDDMGRFESIAVDPNLQRAYLAINNTIVMYSSKGFEGSITMPDKCEIYQLDVDKKTSSLSVSSGSKTYGEPGEVDILLPEAIKELTVLPERKKQKVLVQEDKIIKNSRNTGQGHGEWRRMQYL